MSDSVCLSFQGDFFLHLNLNNTTLFLVKHIFDASVSNMQFCLVAPATFLQQVDYKIILGCLSRIILDLRSFEGNLDTPS